MKLNILDYTERGGKMFDFTAAHDSGMSLMTNQSDSNPVVIFSMEKPSENLTLVSQL